MSIAKRLIEDELQPYDTTLEYRVPPPHPDNEFNTRVWCKLPQHIHEYFFRKVLAGEHRAKQELTASFYEALYAECIRRGIPAGWDVDSARKIQTVMSNLNFNDQRRTTNQPAKHQAQPTSGQHGPRPADSSRTKTTPPKPRARTSTKEIPQE
jgi:hypothetical protein